MTFTSSRVVFETPKEVRAAIQALDTQLFTVNAIHSEACRIYPDISLKDIERFIADKHLPKETFTLVYSTLYFFLERYRDELEIPKSEKRLFLEKEYAKTVGNI